MQVCIKSGAAGVIEAVVVLYVEEHSWPRLHNVPLTLIAKTRTAQDTGAQCPLAAWKRAGQAALDTA